MASCSNQYRDHGTNHRPVYAATSPPASFPNVAHVPGEPCKEYGLGGLLYGTDDPFPGALCFLVLAHDRRRILQSGVTAHPTVEWTVQQLRHAFSWESAPRYLLRDRDRIFREAFVEQVKSMESVKKSGVNFWK